MGPDGTVGSWSLVTDTGDVVCEGECLWPDVDRSIRIREFWYHDAMGHSGHLEKFDAYGFQRYQAAGLDGKSLGSGAQILAVKDDEVTVLEIDDATGRRTATRVPLSQLTYNRELMRDGDVGEE